MRGLPSARWSSPCRRSSKAAATGLFARGACRMSDVNTFIDTIGKDVNATVVPQIQTLAQTINAKAHTDYVPKISAFANDLVKQIIDEQSETVRTFVSGMIVDLFARYKPEITGELHANMVAGAIEVTGQG